MTSCESLETEKLKDLRSEETLEMVFGLEQFLHKGPCHALTLTMLTVRLGLRTQPHVGDNVIHGSASPLEAAASCEAKSEPCPDHVLTVDS